MPRYPNRESTTDEQSTGRIGEEYVYKHLCNVYKEDISTGAVRVEWLNDDGESKSPYDLRVSFAQVCQASA